jgi:hypothetical protein
MMTEDSMDRLRRLDDRSATYGKQFWQVPIAYVAAGALATAQAADKAILPVLLLANGIIGGFIVWHLAELYSSAKRAFHAIESAEKRLGIPDEDQSKWTPGHLKALLALAIVAAGVFLISGTYLVYRRFVS